MKGNIGIKFNNLEKIIEEEKIFEEELPNYYNDLFKLKLISNGEPVLLMGPSSYKTHLAKYFIKEICLKNFNIINLNQKTTLEELLGGPYILPPYSYMFFYNLLKNITNYEENKENSITEGLNNMKKIIEQEKNKGNKYIILNSLKDHALENLIKYNDYINQNKNKDKQENKNNNDLPQLVFNMGSILLSILKDESLIFKDIHEVSTEIFERFNELFGSERILSLNEDIYGTLFKQRKDEISINKFIKLDNNISIFATCPENSFHSLSESITSRFSVICVGEHGIKEKEKIIRNYSMKCNIMNNEIFKKISELFLKENFTNINKLKNLIDIFDEMNKNNVNNNQEIKIINNNLNYIMFYIKLNDKSHLYDIIHELNNRQSPLINENNFLISKISKLKIHSPKKDDKDSDKIAFTPVFNEMADLLHFGICTGTPLILEGFPGQGKQKVINYISNLINYDVENIIITNNFSVDDLFKKTVLESKDDGTFTIDIVDTKLNKILSKSHSIKEAKEKHINKKPILFVFHNIHKARADVLSKISYIFNKKCINSKYFFIGLINLKESFIERKSYYYTYFYNSIYYIVNSTNIDISFYKQLYKGEDIDTSILKYFNNKEYIEGSNFTITDFIKFISLKNISHFDEGFLEEIVFKKRYYLNNVNKKKIHEQNQSFDLDIYYKNQNKEKIELILELNKIPISLEASKTLDSFEKEKNTLSFEQMKCLIILGLAVKSKKSCILQGETGIGKSHLIKFFAKLLGKKLHILELNKDNDISILTKRYVFKEYEKEEENEIETVVNDILESQEDIKKLDLNEKIKKLFKLKLDDNKKKKLEQLKEKYKFIHRFKYEKSEILKAIENGEWILLDGIENAPASIIEKVVLLCGDKPELNLYEIGQKPIIPKEGFHLFMTYNPDRMNHNESIPKIILDKCLVYYLDSFINNGQAISQIIYGFLVNSNYLTDTDLLYDVSSRISNIHYKIMNNLENESEKITERTIINFCKNLNLNLYNEVSNSFPHLIKNNFLYFYFPSGNIDKFDKIINDVIKENGIHFVPLAKSFKTECKESLNLIKILEENIEKKKNNIFNLGEFIFSCLNIHFVYLENIQKTINDAIDKADKSDYKDIYLPLKTFDKYLDEIYKSYINQEKIMNKLEIRTALEFSEVRKLLLFEKLYKNGLLSWEGFNILYQNINILNSFIKLSTKQNLESLGLFFDEIILNIKYIKDIINIFPYSFFKETKFSLINDILSNIIKKADIKKINFIIKIKEKEYFFKYEQNDNVNISILLDLNVNDSDELIITKETKVFLILKNQKKNLIKEKEIDKAKLNRYFLLFIEKFVNSPKVDKKTYINVCNEVENELNDNKPIIKFDFNFQTLFKKKNNLVVNIWSILYLIGNFESYLNKLLNKFEKELFKVFIFIREEILKEPSNTFETKLNAIINMSKDLLIILDSKSFLVNLLYNDNYIGILNNNSIEDRKATKKQIENEIKIIDAFIIKCINFENIKNIFIEYSRKLGEEIVNISKEIDQLEIHDYKQRIENKVNNGFQDKNLKAQLLNNLKNKDNLEDLKKFDSLVHYYLSNYNNKTVEKKINIFSMSINMSENITEDKNNNNVKLIEILLKYSKIKELINDISNDNNNKFISLNKLSGLIFKKNYQDVFISFLLKDDSTKNNIKIVNEVLKSLFVQEVIYNDLVQNLIDIKKLLNNLYEIKNSGKIDEGWCKRIELKYNLNSIIYMPKLTEKSFLNLFIKDKNIKQEKEIGFLLDINISTQNSDLSIINDILAKLEDCYTLLIQKETKDLILEIGNILIKCLINQNQSKYFKDLNNLSEYLENHLKQYVNMDKINEKEKFKIDILQNYQKAKQLYLNYDNEESLLFDEINEQDNRKELFTKIYPSLLNYFNCNQKVYKALLNEPEIFNFKSKSNSIPLWLICLRSLANSGNIKSYFENNFEIINKFEKEFTDKLKENIKRNYKDIYWILLITPNHNKFLVNEYYERMYKFSSFLLYEISLLRAENQNRIYDVIKKFIFNLFDDAYDKGIDYFLTSKINLFDLGNNLSEEINKYIIEKSNILYNSEVIKNLKSLIETLLNDINKDSLNKLNISLKNELKTFENNYSFQYNKSLLEIKFSKMVSKCEEYNNLIDIYKNNPRTKNEIDSLLNLKNNEIQIFVEDKDAFYLNEQNTINKILIKKVKYLQKNEYIDKNIKYYPNKKVSYFININPENIDSIFRELKEKLNEIIYLINQLDKSNIHKLNGLKHMIEIFEEKMELFEINDQFDIFIVEKIIKDFNIKILSETKYILSQLNNIIAYIKSILINLKSYENDKDTNILKYMKKEYYIYFPEENSFQSIKNNDNEYFIIKNEKNIIPYYIIQNNEIIGCDEIKYDLGTLNLNDSEYQNLYFTSFDENIKYTKLEANNDVNIIKKNKLYLLKVKIKEKKEENIEKISTEGTIKFNFEEKEKIIKYQINYQLEAMSIYLKCDKYKLKYIEKSTFLLNTPILFNNEIINFTVKNLYLDPEKSENNFRINLRTYEDNTCKQSIINKNKDGFSLQIKSDSNNDKLSYLLTIYICQRFHILIKVDCQIKPFDFEFLISQDIKQGFLNKKIFCPFEQKDDFNFILYIGIAQNRFCELSFEKDYNQRCIKISQLNKTTFIESIQIKINIKLLQKEETFVKLKAKIDNKINEIDIIFTSKNKCNNSGYKSIKNEIKSNDNSDFFAFTLNELSAKGMEMEGKPKVMESKRQKNYEIIDTNQMNNTQKINIEEINKQIKLSINGIVDFYDRISEAARLLPVYCLNYKNKSSSSKYQKLIRKNFHILEEIYKSLTQDDEIDAKFYENNFFYESIREFIISFDYLNSVIELKDKNSEKEFKDFLEKLQNFNDNNIISKLSQSKLFESMFKKFKNTELFNKILKNQNLEKLADSLNKTNLKDINQKIISEIGNEKLNFKEEKKDKNDINNKIKDNSLEKSNQIDNNNIQNKNNEPNKPISNNNKQDNNNYNNSINNIEANKEKFSEYKKDNNISHMENNKQDYKKIKIKMKKFYLIKQT